MSFYSTNQQTPPVSLREAVTKGLADDNGLFMPASIPELPHSYFEIIQEKSLQEIALDVSATLLRGQIERGVLQEIVEESLNFPIPVVPVHGRIHTLELFHGPTSAFKDVGARFMARLLAHFVKGNDKELTILVATSGDTGSAVANGFLGVPGINVVILYPSGKVSDIQEKQLTTLGQNITALEIDGTFDDCQRLVKQAFLDQELNQRMQLTSANSINIARLIPQSFYYFHAYAQVKHLSERVIFAIPSGNFGNLTGGLLAKRMGLPVAKFIAATNINDIIPEFLTSGNFNPRPSVQTISNAMDVGNPSNFVRLMDLYNQSGDSLGEDVIGYRFTDEQTKMLMREVYENHNYILDPHGAIGYGAIRDYLATDPEAVGIFLETAHPAKFMDVVEEVIGQKVTIPENLQVVMQKTKQSIKMGHDYTDLKEWLLTRPS